MIGIALIGAGRIGQIRARVLTEVKSAELLAVADANIAAAVRVALPVQAKSFSDWRECISAPGVDAVIVATPTVLHAEIASAALAAGKHVLCEKPLARNVVEAEQIVDAARASGKVLKTGFNYRHLPHIRKAKELIAGGELGELSFMRCHFGHGGRPGFEKEWHTDPEVSGGGVLLEQGIHVMDLIRYLLGEPVRVLGQRSNFFWNLRDVEDNCFCLFETKNGQIAQVHVSWTQWINSFQLELYGQNGYLQLQGRDGHYGPPAITWAKRNDDHSRPCEQHLAFEPGDDWRDEWREFLAAVTEHRTPQGSGHDGLQAQRMIEMTYKSAAVGRWMAIAEDQDAQP